MRIYCEDSLLYAREFFSSLGDLQFFSGKSVRPQDISDAEILLVRSTTKVNQTLIGQCQHLRYVGTATAGTDHMDLAYLSQHGIAHGSAAGCNAIAVAEYVVSAILALALKNGDSLKGKRVGIVGAGHVGSALDAKLQALGLSTLLCDPPLAEKGDPRHFVSMDEIMDCDIISLHVPLVEDGLYPTRHLFDAKRLSALNKNQWLINACRGEVLDNQALLMLAQQQEHCQMVLDVWENEPDVLLELLPHLALATAHIAGHTLEGKARGTELLYRQVTKLLGLPDNIKLEDVLPQPELDVLSPQGEGLDAIMQLVFSLYDIREDDGAFREQVNGPADFRYARQHYGIRREFASARVSTGNSALAEAIYGLGFQSAECE
ncbi:4-phosphoerythronate dehydrogenase [Aliiglaciecola sp. CAU 1673]|uniref:4-phosphoerythronate dehydrogenase n=1 Tax=Aliiglaciecola sp. CAU 1673 TaxID=3032595 RepID=UPI0023DB8C05|nr:4-phosphoerythronate dehydrogenase [Aliiglaciecola sp. CAU 1673]MDF2178051.1 4-phosphoerythronate dehydrogenase [Aliiglaciecola sp. CAU 1673]